jgi:GNAT superfamily N-acetyltransferase
MDYRIRPATPDDIPRIVAHRLGMFRDMGTEGDYPGMAAAFEQWLRREMPAGTYRGWMAESGDGVVVAGAGLIVFPWSPGPVVLDPRCAFVFNVYTDPAHRRQGLARRLMEAVHDWCRSQGIHRIALNASRDGQPIYEAMGYEVAAEPMMRFTL